MIFFFFQNERKVLSFVIASYWYMYFFFLQNWLKVFKFCYIQFTSTNISITLIYFDRPYLHETFFLAILVACSMWSPVGYLW